MCNVKMRERFKRNQRTYRASDKGHRNERLSLGRRTYRYRANLIEKNEELIHGKVHREVRV